MCLAQGHNTVTLVMLEFATTWSRVKHFNIEPMRSNTAFMFFLILGTASRLLNEKQRSPLLVQAGQSLST